MATPTPDQWKQLYRAMGPHVGFFHELHRRLQRAGLHADHRYMLALDRVRDAMGTVAIFTHYAACRREGQIDDQACARPEWWMGEGI